MRFQDGQAQESAHALYRQHLSESQTTVVPNPKGCRVAKKQTRVAVEQRDGSTLPKRVSFSQMSLYEQCGLKYFFSYIDNWQEPPTSALVGGNITHLVLESLYRLEPEQRTMEMAIDLLRQVGADYLSRPDYRAFAEDNQMKQNVREAVENIFSVEDPRQVEVLPEHLEMNLRVEINGVEFTGQVDRFTQGEANRVSDYKTGKSPGRFLESKLVQPFLYARAFREQHDIDVHEVELLFLNSRESFVRPVDDALLTEAGDRLVTMRQGSEKDISAAEWDARQSRLCDYCVFQRICPAFNTDAPVPGSAKANEQLVQIGLIHKV